MDNNKEDIERNAWVFIFATLSFLTMVGGLLAPPFQTMFTAIWAFIAIVTGGIWVISVIRQ